MYLDVTSGSQGSGADGRIVINRNGRLYHRLAPNSTFESHALRGHGVHKDDLESTFLFH